MTKRDFETIAAALNGTLNAARQGDDEDGAFALRMAIADMATALATTNPRFDKARFVAACEKA